MFEAFRDVKVQTVAPSYSRLSAVFHHTYPIIPGRPRADKTIPYLTLSDISRVHDITISSYRHDDVFTISCESVTLVLGDTQCGM